MEENSLKNLLTSLLHVCSIDRIFKIPFQKFQKIVPKNGKGKICLLTFFEDFVIILIPPTASNHTL